MCTLYAELPEQRRRTVMLIGLHSGSFQTLSATAGVSVAISLLAIFVSQTMLDDIH
jgi:hypothetical protein